MCSLVLTDLQDMGGHRQGPLIVSMLGYFSQTLQTLFSDYCDFKYLKLLPQNKHHAAISVVNVNTGGRACTCCYYCSRH